MDWWEKLIIAGLVAFAAIVLIGVISGTGEFRKVCDKAGGTAVFDGRQYQCLITPQ